jgi:phage gp36-like protein
MAFASPSDLIERYDARIVADLASDSGTPAGDVATDTRILTALDDGAGRILAACLNGQIYTEDDLNALTGSSLALLKRINCELAMVFLMGRRPEKFASDDYRQAMESAEQYLELLRKGERLFNVAANVAATSPEIDGPTTTTYDRLNLLPERCRPFYPHRAQRLPLGRG